MTWFWFFTLYSTLGCALEVLFARLTRSRPDRKRALFLPLCPVYGLGACLCLMIAPSVRGNPGLLFLTGAALCTATEYLMALWYERGLGVRFWDYAGQRGNLWGRVCIPFSAAWGLLTLVLAYWLHPVVAGIVGKIPPLLTAFALPAVLADLIVSGVMLHRVRDRACLRWYDRFRHRNAVTAAREV